MNLDPPGCPPPGPQTPPIAYGWRLRSRRAWPTSPFQADEERTCSPVYRICWVWVRRGISPGARRIFRVGKTRTRYQRSYGVTKLATAPSHPAAHVWVVLLAFPSILAATPLVWTTDSLAPFYVLLCGLLCVVPLIEGDASLASWPPLYAIGEKIRPLVDWGRGPSCTQLRSRLLRIYARSTGPLWSVLLGVPFLAGAQESGLVAGLPDLAAGVGLTESGLWALWELARSLAVPWFLLFVLRHSTPANLDLPEMRPEERITEIAERIPRQFFLTWRIAYFVGLPLVAWILFL